jgi:hypothetical protein
MINEGNTDLAFWVILWMGASATILQQYWTQRSVGVGLVLAYVLNFSLIHWSGAVIYLLPWYLGPNTALTVTGFRESAYGLLAFAFGALALAPWLMRLIGRPYKPTAFWKPDRRLPEIYIAVGLFCYFILLPVSSLIPSATAITSAGWNLVLAGLGLTCWRAWKEKKGSKLTLWLVAALSLPFLTIITQGFLGYGAAAFLAVSAFIMSFYQPRWKLVVGGFAIAYLGFSFYVTYMRDRTEIREVVWRQESTTNRLARVYETVTSLEGFNPYDVAHLERIDGRLNQNVLVGAAVYYLESGYQTFASGYTVWQAILSLVPRILWPDKPVVAGSMGLVSEYTGITFAEGTSVGMGQVLEFYMNFGTLGVVLGFLAFGVLISLIDVAARRRLGSGDWLGFISWYLPGLALLQVGGSLVEVASSAGAAIVTALIVRHYVLRRFRGKWALPSISGRGVMANSFKARLT